MWLWNTTDEDIQAALYGDYVSEKGTCCVDPGEVKEIGTIAPNGVSLRLVFTPRRAASRVYDYDLAATGAVVEHPTLGTATRLPDPVPLPEPWLVNHALSPEIVAAAEAGDAEAQYQLGFNLFWGFPYTDEATGYRWLEASAAQDHPAGCRYLGEILFGGDEFSGIEQDLDRAVALFDIAGHGGWPGGWSKMAYAYEHGTLFPRGPDQALHYLKLAAEGGDTLDALKLARRHEDGDGVPHDLNQVIHWLRVSAERGQSRFGDAELSLGMMYHLGHGARQDFAEAERWYARAAELGVQRAKDILEQGFATPPQDTEDAWDMLTQNAPVVVTAITKRALKGNAEAMIELAMRHIYGRGLPHDPAQATAWLRQAAETGNAEACRLLAQRLENGEGADIDHGSALALYHRAANQGDEEAMVGAGRLLMEKGDGMAALAYLDRAANDWHASACRLIGNIYRHGIGVPANPGRAEVHYMLAVATNDPETMVGLARLYASDGHKAEIAELLEQAIDLIHWPACELMEELCPGWGAAPNNQSMTPRSVEAENTNTDITVAAFEAFLVGLTGVDIRRLIAATYRLNLICALKGTPEAARQRLFINLTDAAKADVAFTMEAVGPARFEDTVRAIAGILPE
ncbi:hypothetical protein A6A04_20695 [Paramagnetospirillum marisnigri]|uniref:Flagellar motor switch protein FliG C-terminal domain-containing protein n=1 Tax=Paramagnetospirillum marisnigri TaxID=1285242 RepID=A0A178MEG9_9PROT|nr:hypothetical protein A6A04_20695 [Paramagnetospirillum marisnigri]